MSNNEELKAKLKAALKVKFGELINDSSDSEPIRNQELEAKRQARFTREAWESLTPKERAEFESRYGGNATLKRLAELAKREVDEHWSQAETKRQDDELTAWMQDPEQRIKYKENHYQMLFDLAEQGNQRAQERQRARERRELEAELFDDDLRRIWAGLDQEEQAVVQRLMEAQPSKLEQIQKFKAEHGENPIKNIDDSQTLYRLATEKPKREKWVEPIENIDNVNDPHMLYEMANKQMQEQKEVRK